MSRVGFRFVLVSIFAACIASPALGHSDDRRSDPDVVYTLSNATARNELLAFKQTRDGALRPLGALATGGRGSGGGLGNQGAIASNGRQIVVVNPGSDDVSVFNLTKDGPVHADIIASGGARPISVTTHRDLVYVLNAASDSIAGFKVRRDGKLQALAGSEHALSGTAVDPAQIQFSVDGRTLIVTEKATNSIVLFALDHRGVPTERTVVASHGQTPFGFALGKGRQLIVSEAAGGAANASSVSSYWLGRHGDLHVLDASDATLQTAACWVAVTPDGRFAYVTNTGSGSVTGYRIIDRKSTRLNSSHLVISYAVFCL